MCTFNPPLCIRKYTNNWKKKSFPTFRLVSWECQTSVSQAQRHVWSQLCVFRIDDVLRIEKHYFYSIFSSSPQVDSCIWNLLGFLFLWGLSQNWGKKGFILVVSYIVLLFISRIQNWAYQNQGKIVLHILLLRLLVTLFSKPPLSNYSHPYIACHT